MLRNYFITTFRNLLRNKVNTGINIVGLTLGIACALVLFLLANYAKSYNKFEQNYDRIYRIVNTSVGQGGQTNHTPGVPLPLPAAIKEDFPDFEEVVFTRDHYGEMMFTVNPSTQNPTYFELQNRRLVFTDNNYFKVFTKTWLAGDPNKVLSNPGSTVIAESIADQLFPNGGAMGQTIVFNKKYELVIEGIVADPIDNSDMPFHFFVASKTLAEEFANPRWNSVSSNDQCYVLLPEKVANDYDARFVKFVEKYIENNTNNSRYQLQPMSDLHFNENWNNYSYNSIGHGEIMTLIIIGVFLLLTASINFINLSTAIAIKRSKEVGVRKVMGSTRQQLAFQFLGESFVIITLAMLAALGVVELMIIYINPFLEVSLILDLTSPTFIAALVSGTLAITLLSGLYPAIVMSGFKPALALKGLMPVKKGKGVSLRQSLVVFQFFISQVFIIGTIITLSQMDYLKSVNLGFDAEAIIHLRLPENNINKQKTLKAELERLSGINNVSLSFSPPSSGSVSTSNFFVENDTEEYYTSMKFADEQYIETYGIELIAGRNIRPSDTLTEVLVNEKLLRYIGHTGQPEEIVGKQIRVWGRYVPIVGVMRDFHSVSLHEDIMTIALFSNAEDYRTVALKVNLQNFEELNGQIKKIWKNLYPEYDYEALFYNQQIQEHYEGEQKMASIFSFFSVIAILVGCLGLYGLASFMINQKIKEIGVRKTLGATVGNIIAMFSTSFLKLIFIAFVLATPLAWLAMEKWLSNFVYKIQLSPILFIAGLIATALVAMLTVGYKSVKAALANPVDSLRDE